MKKYLILFVVMLASISLYGCFGGDDNGDDDEYSDIDIVITVSDKAIAKGDSVWIWINITNNGDETFPPAGYVAELYVDPEHGDDISLADYGPSLAPGQNILYTYLWEVKDTLTITYEEGDHTIIFAVYQGDDVIKEEHEKVHVSIVE